MQYIRVDGLKKILMVKKKFLWIGIGKLYFLTESWNQALGSIKLLKKSFSYCQVLIWLFYNYGILLLEALLMNFHFEILSSNLFSGVIHKIRICWLKCDGSETLVLIQLKKKYENLHCVYCICLINLIRRKL